MARAKSQGGIPNDNITNAWTAFCYFEFGPNARYPDGSMLQWCLGTWAVVRSLTHRASFLCVSAIAIGVKNLARVVIYSNLYDNGQGSLWAVQIQFKRSYSMVIYFYSQTEDYAEFSNFAPFGVELDGKWWPTVEHYFQAHKYQAGFVSPPRHRQYWAGV